MKKTFFSMIMALPVILMILTCGCIAKNPVHDIVIQEVKDELQAEYSEDLAMIEKMFIFENTLKITLMDTYPDEKLNDLAKAVTRIFGYRMRANKIRNSMYFVEFHQRKMIDNKMRMRNIATCSFENSTDRIKVELHGLGLDKYRAG